MIAPVHEDLIYAPDAAFFLRRDHPALTEGVNDHIPQIQTGLLVLPAPENRMAVAACGQEVRDSNRIDGLFLERQALWARMSVTFLPATANEMPETCRKPPSSSSRVPLTARFRTFFISLPFNRVVISSLAYGMAL